MDALVCCSYTSFPLIGAESGPGDGEVDDSAETLLGALRAGCSIRRAIMA